MIRTPPQYNMTHPPGQIVNPVNFEQPLQELIKDYQAAEREQLRTRVLELEKELETYKNSVKYWHGVVMETGWNGDN